MILKLIAFHNDGLLEVEFRQVERLKVNLQVVVVVALLEVEGVRLLINKHMRNQATRYHGNLLVMLHRFERDHLYALVYCVVDEADFECLVLNKKFQQPFLLSFHCEYICLTKVEWIPKKHLSFGELHLNDALLIKHVSLRVHVRVLLARAVREVRLFHFIQILLRYQGAHVKSVLVNF